MAEKMHSVVFFASSQLVGDVECVFNVYQGWSTLDVTDEDGTLILAADDCVQDETDEELTKEGRINAVLLMSRLYDALNGGDDEHASNLVAMFIDSGDPFHDIRR